MISVVFDWASASDLTQSGAVESVLMLQGRAIGAAQLQQLRQLLASHPEWSRYRLSRELCSLWDWRAPNGQLQDMAARSAVAQAGAARLPGAAAKRRASPNRMRHKQLRPVAHASEPIHDRSGPVAAAGGDAN